MNNNFAQPSIPKLASKLNHGQSPLSAQRASYLSPVVYHRALTAIYTIILHIHPFRSMIKSHISFAMPREGKRSQHNTQEPTMETFEHSIGAILNSRKETFGTCFLVAQNKLLTCAHVIKSAGGVDTQLFVRFSGTEDLLPVQLAANGWHPKLDIACLDVNDVPQTIPPLLLSTADKSEDHPFRTIGFPTIGNYRGLVAEGTVYGLVEKGIRPMLQLDTKNVTTGFSGAPVFDTQQQCVVGMVVEVYNAKLTHKLRDAAFALPMSQIWQTIPELHPPQTRE
ncbi:MAG: trypsin-like peptidase domain-containing protein, partial [Chloroflexi bacterium]|nr:trypsin-like peptidase domain-containing protein [Chloroflexota bacterium]